MYHPNVVSTYLDTRSGVQYNYTGARRSLLAYHTYSAVNITAEFEKEKSTYSFPDIDLVLQTPRPSELTKAFTVDKNYVEYADAVPEIQRQHVLIVATEVPNTVRDILARYSTDGENRVVSFLQQLTDFSRDFPKFAQPPPKPRLPTLTVAQLPPVARSTVTLGYLSMTPSFAREHMLVCPRHAKALDAVYIWILSNVHLRAALFGGFTLGGTIPEAPKKALQLLGAALASTRAQRLSTEVLTSVIHSMKRHQTTIINTWQAVAMEQPFSVFSAIWKHRPRSLLEMFDKHFGGRPQMDSTPRIFAMTDDAFLAIIMGKRLRVLRIVSIPRKHLYAPRKWHVLMSHVSKRIPPESL